MDDKPECTVRAAIMAANAAAKAQTISFEISVLGMPMITVTPSLPTIKAPVRVDGTTQVVDGSG